MLLAAILPKLAVSDLGAAIFLLLCSGSSVRREIELTANCK